MPVQALENLSTRRFAEIPNLFHERRSAINAQIIPAMQMTWAIAGLIPKMLVGCAALNVQSPPLQPIAADYAETPSAKDT
jgi:hypothetical protein